MANIKSAIKRNKQNEKRHDRNRKFVAGTRTFVKKAQVAIEGGEPKEAQQAVLEAISALDKAAEKGILHKNNVARRKSRLMKRLASIDKQAA